MSYLTSQQAGDRLGAFGLPGYPAQGLLDVASRRLDSLGPFVGNRLDPDQPLAFPRDVTLDGDTEGEVPDAILDWVALEAHRLSKEADEDSPISSVSLPTGGTLNFARPATSREERIQRGLIHRYLAKTALVP